MNIVIFSCFGLLITLLFSSSNQTLPPASSLNSKGRGVIHRYTVVSLLPLCLREGVGGRVKKKRKGVRRVSKTSRSASDYNSSVAEYLQGAPYIQC